MKADDFRALDREQIGIRMDEMKRELFDLRMQLHSGQLTNTNRLKRIKRDVARALTVINELERAESATAVSR